MTTGLRHRQLAWVFWVATCVTFSSTASAHHSFAMFDNNKCISLTGTVRNFEWNFPHSWIWLVVSTTKGDSVIWGFEGEPPSDLSRSGWTRSSLKKGDKITVKFSPLRNGQNGGSFSIVTLADGRNLYGARDACKGAAARDQQLQGKP